MFSSPRLNVYESDEGFAVEVLGRTGLRYTEGPKSLRIDSEVLSGPHGMAVYKSSIKAWDPPYNDESIDTVKRDEIVENVRRAFRFQGFDIEVY